MGQVPLYHSRGQPPRLGLSLGRDDGRFRISQLDGKHYLPDVCPMVSSLSKELGLAQILGGEGRGGPSPDFTGRCVTIDLRFFILSGNTELKFLLPAGRLLLGPILHFLHGAPPGCAVHTKDRRTQCIYKRDKANPSCLPKMDINVAPGTGPCPTNSAQYWNGTKLEES